MVKRLWRGLRGTVSKKSTPPTDSCVLWLVVKRTIAGRWLFLAVATLTLASQMAVAVHTPAMHQEETASKCQDKSEHFCAETTAEHSGRCVLCQASLGGIALILATHSESFNLAVPVAISDLEAPRSTLKFSPTAPRAPPFLPV